METKNNILDSLKGEKSPFKVPEGYFDTLDSTIHKVIDAQEKDVKTIPLFSKVKPLLYIAASIALMVCTASVFIIHNNNLEQAKNQVPEEINGIQTKVLYSHLEDESIIDYLLSNEE